MVPPHDVEELVQLFKVLGDESRLRIIGLLAQQPQSVEAIAKTLALSAPTVSHHLAKLKQAGLVAAERDQYYQLYHFRPEPLTALAKSLLAQDLPRVEAKAEPEDEVLKHFLVDGRLSKIPAQRKKRDVVLRFLAARFEPQRRYSEREVNELLLDYHDDFCTLRRELVMAKLLDRSGGTYWRTEHEHAVAPAGFSH